MPPELRGTYAGLAHPVMIDYLQRLGVTRSSSCRCPSSCPSRSDSTRHLPNYWGYNTIGYFAPHNGYSAVAKTTAGRLTNSRRW